MKVLGFASVLIIAMILGAVRFPGRLIDHPSLLVCGILGIVAALCYIVAIALNGCTCPTKRNQRRPYLYTLITIGFMIFIVTTVFALASAALRFWWPQ